MQVFEGHNSSELYRQELISVWQDGDEVSTRGFNTRELLNVATVVQHPEDHCVLVPGRRWNPWLALSEALWILAGRDDIAPLLPYNKNIASFSDDGIRNYGAYGKRIGFQLEDMIARLDEDHNDRRAVVSIWRPEDLTANTKDPPCNDMIMFKLRQNRLHMTVINRSNDLHWGLYAVNLPTFGLIQEYVAARLGCELGFQTHMSNSLHIYTGGKGMKDNWRITERMLGACNRELPDYPQHKLAFTGPIPLDTLQGACNAALDDAYLYTGIPFIEFAQDFLGWYRTDGQTKCYLSDLRHAKDYADWIVAAELWIDDKERF